MIKKLIAIAAIALLPLGASAATCSGTPNDLSVVHVSAGDNADCGTLDLANGPIDVDGTFGPNFGAPGNAILQFNVIGAPATSGAVSVILNGISLSNISASSFGGSSIAFIDIGNALVANLSAPLPTFFGLALVGMTPASTYTVGLSAIPVPAAGFLLLGGLGGLAALRRRKKA